MLPIALVAPELGNVADALKGQVERRPPKLLDELAGVRDFLSSELGSLRIREDRLLGSALA